MVIYFRETQEFPIPYLELISLSFLEQRSLRGGLIRYQENYFLLPRIFTCYAIECIYYKINIL